MSKLNKWFTAWVIQGTRIEKLTSGTAAFVILVIALSLITGIYWAGGGEFKRSWPFAGLLAAYGYITFLVVNHAINDYRKRVFFRNFK